MADKTKIWGAIPWWIFSWGGCTHASRSSAAAPLPIFTPLRLSRNLLLILITPREWIGRNIRQIGPSYIFYLHIPLTASQAQFLSLYFLICFRVAGDVMLPWANIPGWEPGCSHQTLSKALQECWGGPPRRAHLPPSILLSAPCSLVYISARVPTCLSLWPTVGHIVASFMGTHKLLWVLSSHPFRNFLLKYVCIRKAYISEMWIVCFHKQTLLTKK